MQLASILKCPVCEAPLSWGDSVASCPSNHTFDLARSGYLNLVLPNKKHSPEPGDSLDMMRSRRAFLGAGFYEPVARATNDVVADALRGRARADVADLGCGEGYFLAGLRTHLNDPAVSCYGVDISRPGIRMSTTHGRDVRWIVASLHASPFVSQSLDVVLSMCAPIAVEDLHRVLRDDGALVTVTPGPDHLDALRAIIYPSVVPHPPEVAHLSGDARFALAGSTRVRHAISLNSPREIADLLAMTPYYWNISRDTKARVDAVPRLDLTVDLQVNVFRKAPLAARL